MKKSNAVWIVAGTLAACLAAFSAGMSYALEQLKKIQPDDLSPAKEDEENAQENTEE